MDIKVATIEDFDKIYDLWKRNKKKLGAPWRSTIQRQINKGEFYLLYIDEKFVGMVCIHYYKRNQEYDVEALVIEEDYRGKGYGTYLLKYAVNKIKDSDLPLYLGALNNDENNQFYDRFCTVHGYSYYKTCTIKVYKVDTDKLFEL